MNFLQVMVVLALIWAVGFGSYVAGATTGWEARAQHCHCDCPPQETTPSPPNAEEPLSALDLDPNLELKHDL